jgi:hypothetical protein
VKNIKSYFVELFTIMAWISLSGYIFFCTFSGIKDESSVRDAWNLLLFIGGYVWAKSTDKEKKSTSEGTTTAEISATITQQPNNEENNPK